MIWKAITFLTILGLSLVRASRIPELDVLWGARNGTDIINGGSITAPVDSWNFLTEGETWSPNSWLWNVLLGITYSTTGTFGFWVVVFLSNIIIYMLLWLIFSLHKIPLSICRFPLQITNPHTQWLNISK